MEEAILRARREPSRHDRLVRRGGAKSGGEIEDMKMLQNVSAVVLLAVLTFSPIKLVAQAQTTKVGDQTSPGIRVVGGDASKYFSSALIYLGNQEVLQLRPELVIGKGKGIGEILRRQTGAEFLGVDRDLEAYLCRINSHVCELKDRGPHDWKKLRQAPNNIKHDNVRKTYKTACPSNNLPKYVVCIPDIRVTNGPELTTVVRHLRTDDDLPSIVVKNTRGCKQWDNQCAKKIILQNQSRLWLASRLGIDTLDKIADEHSDLSQGSWWRSIEGAVRLPAISYAVSLDFVEGMTNQLNLTQAAVRTAVAKYGLPNQPEAKNLSELSSIFVIMTSVAAPSGNLHPQALESKTSSSPSRAPASSELALAPNEANPFDQLFNLQVHDAMHFRRFRGDKGQKTLLALPKVNIGIWDLLWDETHCKFYREGQNEFRPSDKTIYRPAHNVIAVSDPTPGTDVSKLRPGKACEPPPQERRRAMEEFDHATFIAGLLAAQSSSLGTQGLNPKASLWMYHFTIQRIANKDDPFGNLADFDFRIPTAVNVSQSSDTQLKAFATIIGRTPAPGVRQNRDSTDSRYTTDTLFVIAAGNGGNFVPINTEGFNAPGLTGVSRFTPQLREGVITVVALGTDGLDVLRCQDSLVIAQDDRLKSTPIEYWGSDRCSDNAKNTILTNYGDFFDVAAVGVSVGPVYEGRFGFQIGTSVAAPYVTGLASLIRAQLREKVSRAYSHDRDNWSRVINEDIPTVNLLRKRILFTADPLGRTDEGPIVRFGRINFDRALNFDTDIVIPDPAAASAATVALCTEQGGGLVLTTNARDILQTTSSSSDQPEPIYIKAIKRLKRNEANDYYLIYDVPPNDINAGGLVIKPHVSLAGDARLSFACIHPDTRKLIDTASSSIHFSIAAQDLQDFTRCSFFLGDCETTMQVVRR